MPSATRSRRIPDVPVEPVISQRWSPRAMSGEPVDAQALSRLFEAARWAPSCFNEQPWRFLYCHRGSAHWPRFQGLLTEGNRVWAVRADVLIVVLSKRTFSRNGKPNRTHSLDTGAAWQNLALQASAMGLVAHGMAGFDYDRARRELEVAEDFAVEMMIAIGKPGDPDCLPDPLREKEVPSLRRPAEDFAYSGLFPARV